MASHLHRSNRSGWLRAGVMGANDGILSVSSLLIGVAAAHADSRSIVIAGAAGLTAGIFAMAAGEYVSVSSQADLEQADLTIEKQALLHEYEAETNELTDIYIHRGLDPHLASQVAQQLMKHDALGAHARDEIGISDTLAARPIQAALASACSFAAGGIFPLLSAFLAPAGTFMSVNVGITLLLLTILGASAAKAGGAPILAGASRVFLLGSLTLALTYFVGSFFGEHA